MPDGRDHSTDRRTARTVTMLLRWLAAVAVGTALLFWSWFLATLIGFDVRGEGPHNVTEHWQLLLAAAAAGVLGIGSARLILRQRVVSWWLLLAVPIPALVALDQGGWL